MTITELLERRPARARASNRDTAPPKAPARRGPGLSTLFSAVFAMFGWAVGIGRLSDNSFFWHLRTGELILDHGIPHHDPFSYTAQGVKWVAQSWLAELTYGVLERTVGTIGIRLFAGLVGAGIGLLSYRLALRLTRDRVIAAGVTIAALAGIYTLWSERPLLIGVLCLVVLVWIVEVPDSALGRRPLVALPVLMWVWANVHGTFELGFAYLALHVLGRWLEGARPWQGRERRLVLDSFLALVVILANPYGVDLLTFPVQLLSRGDVLSHIVEWRSPDFRQTYGMALALWVVVFVVALARGRHRATRRDLVVALPMLLLAFWALRNVALAPLIGLPVVARTLTAGEERADDVPARIGWIAAALVAFVALVMGVRAAAEPDFTFAGYPVKAMQYVDTHGLLGRRLLTDDAAAGYVILQYYPRQQVFIDDRYDMYPRTVIFAFFDIAEAKTDALHLLDRYDVQVIVWTPGTPLSALLAESPRWHRVHHDAVDDVWVRTS